MQTRKKTKTGKIFTKILLDGKLGNLVYVSNPRGFRLPRGVCEEFWFPKKGCYCGLLCIFQRTLTELYSRTAGFVRRKVDVASESAAGRLKKGGVARL